MRYVIITLALAVGHAACASTPDTGGQRYRSDLITAEEIVGTNALNAYEAVKRLRSQWLRSRGSHSIIDSAPSLPVVYVDGQRFGEVEVLRTIHSRNVEEMRYLDARTATARYGHDHDGGAILVKIRN